MKVSLSGPPSPQTATVRRPDDARTGRGEPERGATPRTPIPEPALDQWVPRAEAAGPEPPAAASADGPAPAPAEPPAAATAPQTGNEAVVAAANRLRQALRAQPAQVSGIHGNLVAGTVLNLLA